MTRRSCVYAVSGATVVEADEPGLVLAATRALLRDIAARHAIEPAQVISAIFTTTPDLTSAFPARAARQLGWHDVPLLCMSELPAPDAPPRSVRVLLHVARTAHAPSLDNVCEGA